MPLLFLIGSHISCNQISGCAFVSLVREAAVPGGIGEHAFTRPRGWLERARHALATYQVPEAAAKAERADAARRYLRELLASVESLDAIAEQHGVRTLTDLFYLQQAIVADGFVDHYPNESAIEDVLQVLPSGAHWLTFIRVEDAAPAAAEPA